MFTLLVSFVFIASAIFLAGGKKRDIALIMQEPVSEFGGDETVSMAAPSDTQKIMQEPFIYDIGGDETASTAAPSVTQNTPKPTNSPVTSYTPALTDVTPSTQQPTKQHTTESPTHTKQHTHPSMHHSPRHTDSPTHKHHHAHDVEHRMTYKPTGRPTHKRHTHSDHMSSTPTESPTHLKQHTHPLTQHPPRHTESPTTPPSTQVNNTSVTASDSDPVNNTSVSTSDSDPLIRIKPSALATIEKSNPDFKNGGLEQLSVEGDERISFIHFDLSLISEDVVAKATLNLHVTTHDDDMSATTVRVEMLPHVWAWSAGSVSWNEPLASEEPFLVDYLAAVPNPNTTEQLYEVDVTSAIFRAHQQRVTFRLSTESSGRLWFASEEWNGGELVPELVIVLL